MFGRKKVIETDIHSSTNPPSAEQSRLLALLVQDYLKEKKFKRRWGLFFKLLIIAYISTTTFFYFSTSDSMASADHTAVVDIQGLIGSGDVSAETVNQSLQRAFEAESAKGVIIRINSPGGTPVQAAQINEEITRLKLLYPDKPVYAAISDICASGGYYIAVAADEIFAHPASIVGSIGVLMNGFGFVETMNKLGVERRLITAGENKSMLDPFSPLDPSQRIHAQEMLDDVHQQFISAVKSGRQDRISDNPDVYSGLFWSGEKAMDLGLIDQFGSAEMISRDIIGVETMIDYTFKPKFIDAFANQLGISMSNSVIRYFTSMN